MKVTQFGSTKTYSFKDKAELDDWAKNNIENANVVKAVLEPVMLNGKPKNDVVYNQVKGKAV